MLSVYASMLELYDKRSTTEGAIFGSFGVCTLCCLLVLSFCCFLSSFMLCGYYCSYESALINFLLFFLFSAAINRRPYDCMRSAGEDSGLECVFIERLTNTN